MIDEKKCVKGWSKDLKPKKTRMISVKITKDLSLWLKQNSFSPTGIFGEAVKELGYKEQTNKRGE